VTKFPERFANDPVGIMLDSLAVNIGVTETLRVGPAGRSTSALGPWGPPAEAQARGDG